MKKLHVALAFAGAVAGTAQAQSAVEVYGVVDMGFVRETGNIAGVTPSTAIGNKLSSGVQSGSRLGFKGTEDLGGGLKGLFVLEAGVGVDRGSLIGAGFARQSFVGLQGNFGTVTLGRQYTSYFLALNQFADPFASGLAGNAQNLMLPPTAGAPDARNGTDSDRAIRMNDTIKYATPIVNGFRGEIAFGVGEKAIGSLNGNSKTATGSITYSAKPLNVTLAHFRKNYNDNSDHMSSTLLAANWDFAVAKVFAALADNDWGTLGKNRDYLIGATVPFGPHTFIVSYIRKDARNSANNADQAGFGYSYALSKRTNLYAAYGRIDNKGLASYRIGNNSDFGTGDTAFNLGVRHLF